MTPPLPFERLTTNDSLSSTSVSANPPSPVTGDGEAMTIGGTAAKTGLLLLLVLGAGTAGTMAVNKLRPRLDADEWQITIVDQDETHYYQPGFLFIPYGIYSPSDVVKPKRSFFPPNVEFIYSDIEVIEPEQNRVKLAKNKKVIHYDQLVIATGSPFSPVSLDDRTVRIGQANNAFIFPGMGLGVVSVRARTISDGMFHAAAIALAWRAGRHAGEYRPIAVGNDRDVLVGAGFDPGQQASERGSPAPRRAGCHSRSPSTTWRSRTGSSSWITRRFRWP